MHLCRRFHNFFLAEAAWALATEPDATNEQDFASAVRPHMLHRCWVAGFFQGHASDAPCSNLGRDWNAGCAGAFLLRRSERPLLNGCVSTVMRKREKEIERERESCQEMVGVHGMLSVAVPCEFVFVLIPDGLWQPGLKSYIWTHACEIL